MLHGNTSYKALKFSLELDSVITGRDAWTTIWSLDPSNNDLKGCHISVPKRHPAAWGAHLLIRGLLVQRDLIEPAVKGTSNVLRSVARNRKTVRRVVFSSSIAGSSISYSRAPDIVFVLPGQTVNLQGTFSHAMAKRICDM